MYNSDRALSQPPVATAAMLIRKPIGEVFEAFVDPSITSQFWFTHGSARLVAGTSVQWEWRMYGISVPVMVRIVEPDQRIVVEFPGDPPTRVEWNFTSLDDGSTFIKITHQGFGGDGDAVMKQVIDSTEGFAIVLAGAKALLEHGIRLNLVADRFPKLPG